MNRFLDRELRGRKIRELFFKLTNVRRDRLQKALGTIG